MIRTYIYLFIFVIIVDIIITPATVQTTTGKLITILFVICFKNFKNRIIKKIVVYENKMTIYKVFYPQKINKDYHITPSLLADLVLY